MNKTIISLSLALGAMGLTLRAAAQNVGIGTITPTSLLHTNGSFATKYTVVSANTTLDGTHHTVIAVHTSGTITLTLPANVGVMGRQYTIQNDNSGTTNIVVAGGGTMEGLTTLVLNQVGQTVQFVAGSSGWQLISNGIKSATVPLGASIYTADGTLSGNRIVNMGSNSLTFTGSGLMTVSGPIAHGSATYLNNVTQTQAIYPVANNAYDLGTSTGRYARLWATNGDFAANVTIGGNSTTNGASIHNGATYLNNVAQTRTMFPVTTNAYDLGTSTGRYATLWATNGDFAANVTIGGSSTTNGASIHNGATYLNSVAQTHEIVPAADNTYNIGSSAAKYHEIWGIGGRFTDYVITNNYYYFSDGRLKSNIHALTYGLNTIMQLSPKQYDVLSKPRIVDGRPDLTPHAPKHRSIGFIAQELYTVIPEAAYKPKDEQKEYWAVDYIKLIPVLTKAIQEQQAQIEVLKADKAAGERAYAQLARQVKEMQEMLGMKPSKIKGTKVVKN